MYNVCTRRQGLVGLRRSPSACPIKKSASRITWRNPLRWDRYEAGYRRRLAPATSIASESQANPRLTCCLFIHPGVPIEALHPGLPWLKPLYISAERLCMVEQYRKLTPRRPGVESQPQCGSLDSCEAVEPHPQLKFTSDLDDEIIYYTPSRYASACLCFQDAAYPQKSLEDLHSMTRKHPSAGQSKEEAA